MTTKYKRYTQAFKLEAIRLMSETDKPVVQLARSEKGVRLDLKEKGVRLDLINPFRKRGQT